MQKMPFSVWLALLVAASLSCAQHVVGDQAEAAGAVLQRLIPSHANKFRLLIVNSTGREDMVGRKFLAAPQADAFSLVAMRGIVYVNGTSGVALTSGVYWYLKNIANCSVTWGNNGTGDQLRLPDPLLDAPLTTQRTSVSIRYAWNMCTFGYSAPFWDAHRWTREIDWMALHGVNMPLALSAQEYIWTKVFQQLKVKLSDLEEWFTGPAFLPWQRAGNIRGFAGPLTRNWIETNRQLQKAILLQMRQLGMIPILPCFGGHVPKEVLTLFPNASVTQSPGWNSFPPNETDVYYLQPTDPLYGKLSKMFMETLIAEFGTDHFYSCDTFNEVNPTSNQPSYLKAASAAVYEGIAKTDPKGVWVMQAWLFHNGFWNYSLVQAYLSGVPNDAMLILDLNSEAGTLAPQYDQYFGKPWVWNMLHNYGGVRGMYGNMTCIANNPVQHLKAKGSTMVGIGFTPESIEQNPVMYELLTDTFWAHRPINVSQWLQAYITQRYGAVSPTMLKAWGHLFNAVYNQPGEPRSEIEDVPQFYGWQVFGWKNGVPAEMIKAFEVYLKAAVEIPEPSRNGPYQYDLVDVARQSATMFFSDAHRMLVNALNNFGANNTAAVTSMGTVLLKLIKDIDKLLGTNVNYLLGTWTKAAVALAKSQKEANLMLYNAKNIVTLWGPDAQISDYAAKAWHDLYGGYYYFRWEYFLQYLISIDCNVDLWNETLYNQKLLVLEQMWCANTTNSFSPLPTGVKGLDAAKALYAFIANETALAADYHAFPNSTLFGGYLTHPFMWTTDRRQLAILCNLWTACMGFSDDGMVYQNGASLLPETGLTLYVKNSQVPTMKHARRPEFRRKK